MKNIHKFIQTDKLLTESLSNTQGIFKVSKCFKDILEGDMPIDSSVKVKSN